MRKSYAHVNLSHNAPRFLRDLSRNIVVKERVADRPVFLLDDCP